MDKHSHNVDGHEHHHEHKSHQKHKHSDKQAEEQVNQVEERLEEKTLHAHRKAMPRVCAGMCPAQSRALQGMRTCLPRMRRSLP